MTTIDESPPHVTVAEGGDGAGDDLVAKKKHTLALRFLHWANFAVLMVMVWSGMRIYWADVRDPYAVGIGSWQIFEFWPEGVEKFFHLDRALAKGIAYHLVFAWPFVIIGVGWVVHLATRGRWRYLVPDLRGLRDAPRSLAHDLHLRSQEPPRGKYNPMQQLTYTIVLVMGVAMVLSGFAIYKSVQLSFLEAAFGGYDNARFVHFWTTIALMVFFVIHVLQVVRSGWRNFASMITGRVLVPRRDALVGRTTSETDTRSTEAS